MFYYKTSVPLCNCFLFPYFYLFHWKTYRQLFFFPAQTVKRIFRHIPAGCMMPLRLRSPRHHAPDFTFPFHYAQRQAYLLRRYPCSSPATLSPPSRLRHALRSYAHTVSLRPAPGTLLCKRCLAALARCLHVFYFFPFTFSQNFLFHAVAYVLSNRLLL